MNYTLIAYKPNNDDYCRGCLMASFSSNFEVFTTTDREKLLDKWLSVRQAERQHDDHECDYEITILADGQLFEDREDYEELYRLKGLVDARLFVWNKQQDEEDARKKEKQEQSIAQQERDRERAMYLKLKEKFGEQP